MKGLFILLFSFIWILTGSSQNTLTTKNAQEIIDALKSSGNGDLSICVQSPADITINETLILSDNQILHLETGVTITITVGPGMIVKDEAKIIGDSPLTSKIKLLGTSSDDAGIEFDPDCKDCGAINLSLEGFEGNLPMVPCSIERQELAVSLIKPCDFLVSDNYITIDNIKIICFNTGIVLTGDHCGTLISDVLLDDVASWIDIDCGDGGVVNEINSCDNLDPNAEQAEDQPQPGINCCEQSSNTISVPCDLNLNSSNAAIILRGVKNCKIENVFHHLSYSALGILMEEYNDGMNTCSNFNNTITSVSFEPGGKCAMSFYCTDSGAIGNTVMVMDNTECRPDLDWDTNANNFYANKPHN